MDDYYETQRKRKQEAAHRQALADAEYDRERAERAAQSAARDAQRAQQECRTMQADYEQQAEEFREEIYELRDKYRHVHGQLQDLLIAAVPVLRAFVLMASGLPLGVPTPHAVDLPAHAAVLLADLEPLYVAELDRRRARKADTDKSGDSGD